MVQDSPHAPLLRDIILGLSEAYELECSPGAVFWIVYDLTVRGLSEEEIRKNARRLVRSKEFQDIARYKTPLVPAHFNGDALQWLPNLGLPFPRKRLGDVLAAYPVLSRADFYDKGCTSGGEILTMLGPEKRKELGIKTPPRR